MRFGSGGGSCSTSSGLWGALRLFPSLFRRHRFWTFFFFPSHFPSSLCSVTLSLLTLPLSTPPSNALSHHCFSSLPSQPPPPLSPSLSLTAQVTPSHSPFFSPTRISLLVDTHFLSFTPFPHFSLPQSRCQSDTFFSWLYNVY